MIKLGLIARSDNSGLGMQTLGFYKHLDPVKTMVVDISDLNGNQVYPERYQGEGVMFVKGFPDYTDIDNFLDGLDVVLIAEAAYSPYVYERSKQLGIKTAVQYNYEFFDWFNATRQFMPDMLIAPSKWHYDKIDSFAREHGIEHVYLHCPVDRMELDYREIKQARTFLHIAGRSAAYDRNGTETVIRASKLLKTPADIVLHFQGEQGLAHQATRTIAEYNEMIHREGDPDRVTLEQIEFDNYADVYQEGDVMILPRRYGGNCLPLNEALSVGMPVIMTGISPNTDFLPNDWLVMAERIGEFEPRTLIDIYEANPHHLATKIDKFFNMSEHEMLNENVRASNLAETISWDSMKWRYIDELERLCTL